jgi:serpin B
MIRHVGSTASMALLVSLAACGGGTTGDSGGGGLDHGAGAGDAAPSPSRGDSGFGVDGGLSISIAQSSIQRDPPSMIAPSALDAAVTANNAFAVDLYARVRASASPGNLLTSPLSASLALTMAYAGAKGTTATQMATALHFGAGAASIFDGQNALSAALASRAAAALANDTAMASEHDETAPSPSDYQLQIVNAVWGDQSYTWERPFLDVLAKSYGTGVYLQDFVHQWDPARLAINAWVSSATNDKINDLLPGGSLDDTTRMVLVNAIHLKLPWQNAFAPGATAAATFTRSDGTTVSTSFMNQDQQYPYVDDGNAQVVGLPLANGQLEIVIALPHGDLATYEEALATGAAPLAVPSGSEDVQLSVPKVTFTSPTFSLADMLKAMGMPLAFDKVQADLTGLCAVPPNKEHLYIADVLQKAMLGMEETGVEAAAATAVVVGATGSLVGPPPPPPIPMVVNRPFVVSIVDVPTGAVLFLGHITDPTDMGSP